MSQTQLPTPTQSPKRYKSDNTNTINLGKTKFTIDNTKVVIRKQVKVFRDALKSTGY